MNTGNGQEQLSDAVKPQLQAIFTLASQWQARVQSAALHEPEAGSSLRGDDDAAHPYEISYAVHGALVSAVDHLDALRALVADAHVVHARTPFTLMRAALENAATAVWLLGPSSRDERILRRLRLAWVDSRDLEKAALRAGQQPPLSGAGWKTKLETVAQARSMTSAQVASITRDRPTFTTIVETAGSEAGDEALTGDLSLVCWMVASGIAPRKALGRAVVRPGPHGRAGCVDTGCRGYTPVRVGQGPGRHRRRHHLDDQRRLAALRPAVL